MRQTTVQQLRQYQLPVGITPTPLSQNQSQYAFIDAFAICVYSSAANSVFFGDATVTVNNGIEIPPGVTVEFRADNERVLYELERPMLRLATAMVCDNVPIESIPFVGFDLTQVFLIAAIATNVVIMPFPRAYV